MMDMRPILGYPFQGKIKLLVESSLVRNNDLFIDNLWLAKLILVLFTLNTVVGRTLAKYIHIVVLSI